ncbi:MULTISPECIES: molybdate ABC transporter permease subunit [unclassified Pseudodesulfovibrio]|uniref:molybdate ABC transporter permease subunit n=1 Tax=unclassified Pseudodesulfovibrio TaxID=2661612 RepID=UPI000FEB7C53|nr:MULTISPECIES: molybdate ABC transporter permease subunit [unclassified Pseudodesulfovibrio]MCJ2164987.1 molybdate ABC transporter permease subunit [Pseudodesulfovibrio sp. S3-i]RWU03571.1 molybdate ABC transporter permease subunit [Pseudodesulfovibrio sp. S3]
MDWSPLLLSAKLAFWTMLLIPVFASPLASLLAFGKFRGKSLLDSVITLPMVMPPTVLGFALLVVMGPRGAAGALWEDMTGERLVFSFAGILIASLIFNLPFAVQPLRASLEKLDPRLLESAAILGLSPVATFFRIVLPNCLGGLAAASILVFAHSLGEFGVILMVGGSIPGETQVASIAIFEAVESLRFNDAFLMSAALVPVCFAVLMIINKINARQS